MLGEGDGEAVHFLRFLGTGGLLDELLVVPFPVLFGDLLHIEYLGDGFNNLVFADFVNFLEFLETALGPNLLFDENKAAVVELVEAAKLEHPGTAQQEARLHHIYFVQHRVVLDGQFLEAVLDKEEGRDAVRHAVEVDHRESHLEVLPHQFVHLGNPQKVHSEQFLIIEFHHLVAVEGNVHLIPLHHLEGSDLLRILQVGVKRHIDVRVVGSLDFLQLLFELRVLLAFDNHVHSPQARLFQHLL